MVWTIEDVSGRSSDDRVHLAFSVDGPAQFELTVTNDGAVVLFGYETPAHADSEPMLAFDTDGSMWIDPLKRVHYHEAVDDADTQRTGYYRHDLPDQGPFPTVADAAAARKN